MKQRSDRFSTRLLSSLTGLALAGAVAGIASAQQQQEAPAPKPVFTAPGVQLVTSGGVGLEDRAQLAQKERDANLKLVFTEPQGSYLSAINVKVLDRSGSVVLETVTDGPWVLAKLNPGNYRVIATDGNARREHAVSVGAGLRTVQIVMPDQGGIPGRPSA